VSASDRWSLFSFDPVHINCRQIPRFAAQAFISGEKFAGRFLHTVTSGKAHIMAGKERSGVTYSWASRHLDKEAGINGEHGSNPNVDVPIRKTIPPCTTYQNTR
jgi:hypothetical protein